jgi:thiamine-monophosphate kinase
VAVAGVLGRSAAGLALFEAGLGEPAERARRVREAGGSSKAITDISKLIASHQRPRPPYGAGPEAAGLGATSMIDISDGLLADLRHVTDASGVLIDVQTARLPDDPGLHLTGRLVGADPLMWVLTGGEDHALAATFPHEVSLPDRWRVIGSVSDGAGVTVDSVPADGRGGWRHFS